MGISVELILRHQHDKGNNSGTENILRKFYLGAYRNEVFCWIFFSKYDKIHIFLCIWLNLLKKFLMFYFLCNELSCQ